MKFFFKNIIFLFISISSIYGESNTVINIWHQMLYENRKVLRDVCDDYEKNNPGIKINLISRHFMGLTKGTRFAKQIRANLTNLNALKEPEKKLTQIANQLG